MIKIGIVGLGLMGGSIAKALKSKCDDVQIVAFNRSMDILKQAYSENVIDNYSTEIDSIFSGCKIIFLCIPVSHISEYVNKLIPYVSRDCVITDVGSTKGTLFEDMEKLKDNIYFIGGHPMTGSEQTRYSASKQYLYENAYYILSPLPSVPEPQIDFLIDIVKKMGAIPVKISPYEHDYIVAAISHVPHVIAAAIVNMVNRLDNEQKYMHTLAAGGFKDITRIASSSPDMWQNISVENRQNILNVLSEFKNIISEFENILRQDDIQSIWNYYNDAKQYRDSFDSHLPIASSKYFEIYVDILDQLGSIATISTMLSVNGINIKNIGIINNREFENGVLQIVFDTEQAQHKSIELLKKMNYNIYMR